MAQLALPAGSDRLRLLGSVVATLALAPRGLLADIRASCCDFALRIECLPGLDLFVARVEAHCPPLLLVDSDLAGGCPADLCLFVRSLRPDVKILALTWYWSERDETLRGCADGVLHKPPRRAQWSAVLASLGIARAGRAPAQGFS